VSAVRLRSEQLVRIYNTARNETTTGAALLRVQDAVLAANKLLPQDEVVELRKKVNLGLLKPRAEAEHG
jgi:hypothetical protein